MKLVHWCAYSIFILLQILNYCQCERDIWYPKYHLASVNGFMNDPNGMIYYDGYYHAFFQHTPNNVSSGGLKHWGHARSHNMLEWEHLSEALTPSIPSDIKGCYSGSAITDENGTLYLMYTGVSNENGTEHQVQCLAHEDHEIFIKEGQVLESDTYFENFRDPKVWKQDDTYYTVIAATTKVNNLDQGRVVLYKSPDLRNWESQGTLADPLDRMIMECPDMYTINGKQILAFSFQEKYPNGTLILSKTGYLIGCWEPGKEFEVEQSFNEFDKGHDFYASQTFLAKDGRRIQVAWMNMWDTPFPDGEQFGWVGCLTLPRELTINKNGVLVANPIREVAALRQKMRHNVPSVLLKDQQVFPLKSTTESLAHEFEFVLDLNSSSATNFGMRLIDDSTSEEGLFMFILKEEGQLVLRRNYPQYGFPLSDRFVTIDINSILHIRIFFDFSTVEVFINHGETVMSSRIYPCESQRNLELFTEGGDAVFNNFRSWSMSD